MSSFNPAGDFGRISTAGTNKGEFVPYDPTSYPRPSQFVCNSLELLFGCNVDGLTCTLTLSGNVSLDLLPPPYNDEEILDWELYYPDVFDTKAAGVVLVKYHAGDWKSEDAPAHYQSTDSRTVGYARDPITISWTESYFLKWQTSPGAVTMVEPEDPRDPKPKSQRRRANGYLSGRAVTLYYELDIPDIPFDTSWAFYGFPASTDVAIPDQYSGTPWTLDGNFYGFPYLKNIGIAPKFDGFIWTMDGNFYGFPYIKNSGIAPEYQSSEKTSKLYYDSGKVKKLYYMGQEVKKCYFNGVLVFESG